MRTPVILSTLVLSAGLLAGCGGGADASATPYCKELKAAKADFVALQAAEPDFATFAEAIDTFHRLAGDAPSEVKGDWKALDGAFTGLEDNLRSAGLELEDLGPITAGQVPEGMTADDLAAALPKLQASFEGLDDPSVAKASTAIEKHAGSTCGVDLS
jgi:hypothetical protein